MNRRRFFLSSTAFLLQNRARALETNVHLQIAEHPSEIEMPRDFAGLSYESAQLRNGAFFSPDNTRLIDLFKGLSAEGVLRLGGNLGETAEATKNDNEWNLVDSSAGQKRDAPITPRAIRNLAGFLNKTGWRLIYGLNLGSGSAQRAAAEAECISQYVGSRLIAFQVGNEPDFFAPKHSSHPYTFDQYWTQYQTYVQAVRARVPGAAFAGPDVAAHTEWVLEFAQRTKGDAVLLTGHYYAIGPPEDPTMNAQRLLERDPRLAKQIETVSKARDVAGVPFRMTEGNSCSHGGKPGVSDAYASALWAADYMLFLAKSGSCGVNLHGGGAGTYSPIAGDRNNGVLPRPVYFGMQLAQQLAGGQFFETQLESEGLNVSAYAVRKERSSLLAIVNKDATALLVKVKEGGFLKGRVRSVYELSGPALNARTGVVFHEKDRIPITNVDGSLFITIPAYSAMVAAFS